MKVNENTIYIFLLGILAGIICMQCVNHFRKSPKDVYVDNFEYEKESLGILKREELKNEHYECLDQIAYWGTDSLDSFSLSNLCNDKKLFFCFSEKTCPPCIDAVVDIMNEVFTDEEIKTKIVFVSPDYPARLRNDCYGKKLLSLHNKNLGLPMELEDSFAPFLFIMDKDLCVKYLHIHNKPLPRLTLIYLEEIKNIEISNLFCSTRVQILDRSNNCFENKQNTFLFILAKNLSEGEAVARKYNSDNPDLIIVGSFEEAEGMIEERIVLELEDVPAYLWLPDRITLESRKK